MTHARDARGGAIARKFPAGRIVNPGAGIVVAAPGRLSTSFDVPDPGSELGFSVGFDEAYRFDPETRRWSFHERVDDSESSTGEALTIVANRNRHPDGALHSSMDNRGVDS